MADFIAVIRRAVDGLTENTPEMRVKVYERARAAVVRQLENMKPRPPEAMFQRQLDKLDAAIREVEAEHAEALPADEVIVDAARTETPPTAIEEQAPVAATEPVSVVPTAAAEPEAFVAPAEVHEPVHEPVAEEAEPELAHEALPQPLATETAWHATAEPSAEAVAEPEHHPEPAPVVPDYVIAPPAAEPEARLEEEVHPAQLEVQPYESVPEIAHRDELLDHIAPVAAHVPPVEPIYQPFEAPVIEASPLAQEPAVDDLARDAVIEPAAESTRQWAVEIDEEPEVVAPETVDEEPIAAMPRVSYDETDVVAGFNDFVQEELNRKVVPPPPARKADKQDDFSWDAPFDDLPEIPKPLSFEKALEAKQKEIAADAEVRKTPPKAPAPVSARTELEDLIGIDRNDKRDSATTSDAAALPPDVSRVVSKLEGKSFKFQKKKNKGRRSFGTLPIALAVAGALVVAGGAYGLWHYRDNVSALVASLMPTGQADKPADTTKTDVQSDAKTPGVKTDAASKDKAAKQTEVASLETDAATQKFTQRLMPDGTEADTDTARIPVDQALPEGKTVAGQTEKGKEVAETTTDTKSDATTDTGKPKDAVQPIGVTQKMFLYEERLGQSSPVAVPGTIVWSEKNDTEGGKPDPSIEAQIDIPERQIKALISIKRNTDTSLPASHIIEIVFALPKNFEEGNIESVQRVAFKQTEQDRGNPLIAVPAKITDDFHMVALNDDADARKVNLELMKTRSWIDIPITYRNGRRALITLEKGATGTAVFDKVMGEWTALGDQTSN